MLTIIIIRLYLNYDEEGASVLDRINIFLPALPQIDREMSEKVFIRILSLSNSEINIFKPIFNKSITHFKIT